VALLKVSHEITEIGYAGNWHSVVHRNPDTWVEGMSSNLDDFSISSFLYEQFLQLFVTAVNSHNNVDSASPFLFDFGRVETVGLIDSGIEHSASLLG